MPPLNNFQKSCVALAIGQALTLQGASAADIYVDAGCTLREAIVSANDDDADGNGCEDGSGPDTINLESGTLSYTNSVLGYYGPAALPTISSYITLQGDVTDGTVIERYAGSPDFRLVEVESYYSLTLNSITLQNGKADYGGALYARDASVTINDSVINGNYASDAGGGIFLYYGDLSITDSTVSDNTAGRFGGGITVYDLDSGNGTSLTIQGGVISGNTAVAYEGAGIYVSSGILEVNGTTVQSNEAVSGAAIYTFDSTVTLDSVTLQSNYATGSCGAAQIEYSSVQLLSSTVAENTAIGDGGAFCLSESYLTVTESNLSTNISTTGNGGAIYSAYTMPSTSTVSVDRSTVSGNSAMNGAGAFIAAGDLAIDKSTFSGNSAFLTGGAVHHDGAELLVKNSTISGNNAAMMSALGITSNVANIYSSTVYGNVDTDMNAQAVTFDTVTLPKIYNTIIAGNSYDNCGGIYAGSIPAANNNWFDDISCDGVTQGSPMLDPLGDNNAGLPNATFTHLPKAASGVLDAGDPANCTVGVLGLGPFDQRGAPRNKDVCDIGAVEKAADEACFVLKAANGNVINFCL